MDNILLNHKKVNNNKVLWRWRGLSLMASCFLIFSLFSLKVTLSPSKSPLNSVISAPTNRHLIACKPEIGCRSLDNKKVHSYQVAQLN